MTPVMPCGPPRVPGWAGGAYHQCEGGARRQPTHVDPLCGTRGNMVDTSSDGPAVSRRRPTLLYTDLVGSTALGAAMEPEDYRALLQALRAIWHEVAQALQARVVLTQGDGALIAFGIPLAGEQDGRHAVDAALRVHARVAALRPAGVPAARLPLRMHSAVHAGTLLLAAGDIEQGVFDLSGGVLNTTVQLVRTARPGEVLATSAALGPNAMFFELGDPPPAALAVLQGGVATWHAAAPPPVQSVLGRSSAARRFDATARRGLTPFIGRGMLHGRLLAFLQQAVPTDGRCLVLQGTAGLGKTRLLEEVLAEAEAGDNAPLLLRGSCESDLGAEVLQPFLQMLRSWLAARADLPLAPSLPADDAAALRAVAGAPAASALPGDLAGGAVGLLQRAFVALARQQPCVLVIDDWQWADDASRQLLQGLLGQVDGPRLLLAARPREGGAPWLADVAHADLQPFTPAETDAAVQRLLPRPDPFLIARIHDDAGGVPLFIEELCHSVSADHLLTAIGGRGGSQGWLATLVVARLQRLPDDQAAVVRAAAVVGNLVPLHWLAVACGGLPAPALLQALADADFLRPEAGGRALRFKHGITRDAVYESIGRDARVALHRRLQDAMQREAGEAGSDGLEALARHSHGAADWAAATLHAEQAGDRAMGMFALDSARRMYLAAMTALERQGALEGDAARRWCLLSNKLGMTCIFDTLALPDALQLFRRAVDLADALGDAGVRARADYWMGYLCYGHGHPRQAEAHCRRGLQLAGLAGDARLAAQLRATLGQVLAALGRYDDAMGLMSDALVAKRGSVRAGSNLAIGSAFTLACQASVLGDRGRFAQAHAAFDEAHALVGDSAHPVANSVRSWAVMVLLWQGRWDDAQAVADESIWLAQRSSALLQMTIARAAKGCALWMRDQADDGFAMIEEAVQWMAQRQVHFYTTLYHGWLVEALVDQGQAALARRSAARLFARARAGELLGLAGGCRALALADAAAGDARRAWRRMALADSVALRRGSQREQALNRLCSARLHAALGDAGTAARDGAAACTDLLSLEMHWHAGAAQRWLQAMR